VRTCHACGARLEGADRFCSGCGVRRRRRPRWLWLVAVGLLLVTGLGTTLALFACGTGPGLQGQVVDGMSGSSVTGAVVRVGVRKAVTDAEGRFSLEGFDPGRATVRVSAPGYEPLRVTAPTSPVILGLLPAAVWSEEYPIPRDREHTVDTGRGLTVTAAAGEARELKVREHTGGTDAAVDIKQAFTLELTGVPGSGKRQATLTFELPPEVEPAQAVILRWTEDGWCLAVPGDEPGDVAALGGTPTADGRAITMELDSLSTYALATFRQELRAFPISTRVVRQDLDADGNLVVEVLLEQPRQLVDLVGAWYEVEVRPGINFLSVTAPDDALFGLPAWSADGVARGFIAPGEAKRLLLVFRGFGGTAQLHFALYDGLPMAVVDWVCRLATGSNLPWPLTVTGAVETFAEPLVDLVGFLRGAELARQVQEAVEGVSWGATVLQGPRAVLGRVQTEVAEYAATRGLEQLYAWFGDTLGRRDWTGRPLGKARAWTEQTGALWLRFIRTTDMSVSTAVHAQMGYGFHTGTVAGYAPVKITVEPATAEVQAGQSVRFTARVTTLDGGREVNAPIARWEVSGGGKVSGDGVFTAGQTGGTFRVTALTFGVDLEGNPRRIEGSAQGRVAAPAMAAETPRTEAPVPSRPPAGTETRRPTETPPPGRVSGSEHRPIAGANVSVTAGGQLRGSDISGAGGRFSIGNIVANTGTTVDVKAEGRVGARISGLAVGAGQVESLAVALDHAYGALEFHVVDGLAGTPVAGATVTVQSGKWTGSGSTGPDGRCIIAGIEVVTQLTIQVEHREFVTRKVTGIPVVGGVTTVMEVRLAARSVDTGSGQGTVTGVVTDAVTGAPIKDAGVTISSWGGGGLGIGTIHTGSDGVFVITGVPATSAEWPHRVSVGASGYQWASVTGIMVAGGRTTTVSVSLWSSSGTVTGVVTDAVTGAPIKDAGVTISSWGGGGLGIGTIHTGSDGVFVITGVPATSAEWPHRVSVGASGYQWASVTGIMVAGGRTTTVPSKLSATAAITSQAGGGRQGSLSGRVVDAMTGAAISGAHVTVKHHGTVLREVIADASGLFRAAGLDAGQAYGVTATSPGYVASSLDGVSVAADSVSSVRLALVPQHGTVSGTVSERLSAAPDKRP